MSKTPSIDEDEDIIELTDTATEKPEDTNIPKEVSPSESSLPFEDKDLFVFTDSGNDAFIEDDDILSDTVFADEPFKETDQEVDKERNILSRGEKEPTIEDISIFDDTVFANEPSKDDEDLAVLTEIDDTSQQIENGMFNDTVFSGDLLENDEELAVITETETNKTNEENVDGGPSVSIDRPSSNDDNNMVLLEDTESESLTGEIDEGFIQPDALSYDEGEQLEIETATDGNIADSLGMDLESKISLTEDSETEGNIKSAIEPDLENLVIETEEFETEKHENIERDTSQVDLQKQPVSPEFFSIQPEQFEKVVENVIKKMIAEKIDSILIDVIEKAVKTDIEKIKQELLKGTTDDS